MSATRSQMLLQAQRNMDMADYLAEQNAGPVVVVLPSTQNENTKTQKN